MVIFGDITLMDASYVCETIRELQGEDKKHHFGGPVMMTAEVMEIMQWLHSHEGGNKDHSAIAQYYEFMTGM